MTPGTDLHYDYFSRGVDDTLRFGRTLGRRLRPADVVALHGELGAGKTQLVRGIADGLGLDPRQVSSPTFVMMQEYEPVAGAVRASPPAPPDDGKDRSFALFHLDAYRIGGPDDLESLGFDDELRATGVSVVEWGGRIAAALGPDVLHLRLYHTGDGTRTLDMTGSGPRSAAVAADTAAALSLSPRPPEPDV